MSDRVGNLFPACVGVMILLLAVAATAKEVIFPDRPDWERGAEPADDAQQGGGSTTLYFPPGPPVIFTKPLYKDNPSCATVKLDVWFAQGRYSYVDFIAGTGPAQKIEHTMDHTGTTLLIG